MILQHCSEEEVQQLVQYAYTGELELAGPAQLGGWVAAMSSLQLVGLQQLQLEAGQLQDAAEDLSMKPRTPAHQEAAQQQQQQPQQHQQQPPPAKRAKLEAPAAPEAAAAPSPAHDTKPETFLRRTLLSLPSQVQSCQVTSKGSSCPAAAGDKSPAGVSKLPSWSQAQLQDAIEAVITQRLRFTQASARWAHSTSHSTARSTAQYRVLT